MARRGPTRLAFEALAVLCVVLAAAWWIFSRSVYGGPTELRAAVPAPAPTPVDDAVVEAVTGSVQRNSSQGAWVEVVAGEHLRADDSLRTGKGSLTDLRIGDRARLTVAESSQLTIREITEKVHRFQLDRGRVKADYKPDDKRVLRIESAGGVAESHGARFSMLSTGTAVAIATDEGAVTLRSNDKAIEVPAGKQAVAVEGQPPAAAEPIPASVLLKVANAAASTDGVCATIDGVAPPGTEITVDGVAAAVDADGRFHVPVAHAADGREVLVALRDASGREETRRVRCVDPPPRIRDFAIHWRKQTP
jgi:hypothetical protein